MSVNFLFISVYDYCLTSPCPPALWFGMVVLSKVWVLCLLLLFQIDKYAQRDLKKGLHLYGTDGNIGLTNAWSIIQTDVSLSLLLFFFFPFLSTLWVLEQHILCADLIRPPDPKPTSSSHPISTLPTKLLFVTNGDLCLFILARLANFW